MQRKDSMKLVMDHRIRSATHSQQPIDAERQKKRLSASEQNSASPKPSEFEWKLQITDRLPRRERFQKCQVQNEQSRREKLGETTLQSTIAANNALNRRCALLEGENEKLCRSTRRRRCDEKIIGECVGRSELSKHQDPQDEEVLAREHEPISPSSRVIQQRKKIRRMQKALTTQLVALTASQREVQPTDSS